MAAQSTPTSKSQTLIPTLHNLHHSQAIKVFWALEELAQAKGIMYHVKNYPRIRPINPDLKKVSPLGKSPILTLEAVDGAELPAKQLVSGVFMESRLINKFLDEEYADGLWTPTTAEDRAQDVYFEEFANSSLLNRVDFPLIFEMIPQAMPFPLKQLLGALFSPIVKIMTGFLDEYWELMEEYLSDEKPWFAGTIPGKSDFQMSFPMDMAVQRGYLKRGKYPKIDRWHKNMLERPAYQAAIKKGGGQKCYDLVTFK